MSTHWIAIGKNLHKVVLAPGELPQVDGRPVDADLRELAPGVLSLLLTLADGTTRSFRAIAEAEAVVVDGVRIPFAFADPRSLRSASGSSLDTGPRPLKAPMPGRIVRVLVADGDQVEQGQGCVVIEAMKMQNELKAPRAGSVARLAATVGSTVTAGTVLLVVE